MEQPLQELAAVNGQTYSYDPNRNLTSNGTKTFIYSVDDSLGSDELHRAAKKEMLELITAKFQNDLFDAIASVPPVTINLSPVMKFSSSVPPT